MPEITGLFATPFMHAPAALQPDLVTSLVGHFTGMAGVVNRASSDLAHTEMLKPSESPLLVRTVEEITPLLVDFGAAMFGERLGWSVKEMWVNVLERGGRQGLHNHANSFISGVAYLTASHPDARTVFIKPPAGTGFLFNNNHAGVVVGPFNHDQWTGPVPAPGDVVLFPSYLLHMVPPNPGLRRITMAFNAIPARLESWGYAISFGG
jgi:hypothetical protein